MDLDWSLERSGGRLPGWSTQRYLFVDPSRDDLARPRVVRSPQSHINKS